MNKKFILMMLLMLLVAIVQVTLVAFNSHTGFIALSGAIGVFVGWKIL